MSPKARAKRAPAISRDRASNVPKTELRLSAPDLRKLHFVKKGPRTEQDTELELKYGLAVRRYAENRLGVELSLQSDGPQVEFHVTYRAVFTLEVEEGAPAPDWVKELRVIAKEIAPSVLFPFLREAITSTASKAGVRSLVPPLVNFRELFKSVDIVIPDAPAPVPEAEATGTLRNS